MKKKDSQENGKAESLLSGGVVDGCGQAGEEFEEKTVVQESVVKKTNYSDLQIYKGGNIIAVRINGRNYTSADANLPEDVKEIIRRVSDGEAISNIYRELGVTPPKGSYSFLSSLAGGVGKMLKNEFVFYWIIIIILLAVFFRQIFG